MPIFYHPLLHRNHMICREISLLVTISQFIQQPHDLDGAKWKPNTKQLITNISKGRETMLETNMTNGTQQLFECTIMKGIHLGFLQPPCSLAWMKKLNWASYRASDCAVLDGMWMFVDMFFRMLHALRCITHVFIWVTFLYTISINNSQI